MSGARRKAFTLLECIVALALFAICSVMLTQACFNCVQAIGRMKKNPEEEAMREFVQSKIVEVDDIDSLKSGVDFVDMNGARVDVRAEEEPTGIADLFLLKFSARGQDFEYAGEMLLIRRNWYESVSDRSELIDDRKDELEALRKAFK